MSVNVQTADGLKKVSGGTSGGAVTSDVVVVELGDISTFIQTKYDMIKNALDQNKIVITLDVGTDRYIATSSDANSISFSTAYGVCTWWNETKEAEWTEFVTIGDAEHDFAKGDHNHDDKYTTEERVLELISTYMTENYENGDEGSY